MTKSLTRNHLLAEMGRTVTVVLRFLQLRYFSKMSLLKTWLLWRSWGKVRLKKKSSEWKSCKETRKQSEFDVVHRRKCKIAYFSQNGKDFISLPGTIDRGLIDNNLVHDEAEFSLSAYFNKFKSKVHLLFQCWYCTIWLHFLDICTLVLFSES